MAAPALRWAVAVVLAMTAGVSVLALESDQYYASARPLEDSSDEINAQINRQIRETLERLNGNHGGGPVPCSRAARKIASAFKMFIFQDIELWALNTTRVPRIPSTPEEELHYRRVSMFRKTSPIDFGASLPPVPTIEIDGIRIGTDKLSHFFAEGWRYHRRYLRALKSGLPPVQAEERAMRIGFYLEKTLLGLRTSGIFSFGDLEANYKGMLFYRSFCDVPEPALVQDGNGWSLARPIDLRDYVTPEWDESYKNPVFSKRRWKKVRPVLRGYCPLLYDPLSSARHASYRMRDGETRTERLVEIMIRNGRLPDPAPYSLEANCSPAGGGQSEEADSKSSETELMQ